MIKFSTEKVLLLHKFLIQETGGSQGVRDVGLLDSAVNAAYATFDGQELFPTKEEKAAKIGYSLISNHAFVDGNKRIGMYIMLTFLEINGISLNLKEGETADVGLKLADGKYSEKELLDWIIEHE